TGAGLQQPKAAATAVPATYAAADDFGVAGSSPSATFARAVSRGQTASATLESRASEIIVPIAQACRPTTP
ncbi:MAG: hypothetical protein JOY69_11260, partial [Candidatus Eremiobacteraeota bacterium]|nr:hypothetical protein [Candidatus Eremiobacteraeota bacterium]